MVLRTTLALGPGLPPSLLDRLGFAKQRLAAGQSTPTEVKGFDLPLVFNLLGFCCWFAWNSSWESEVHQGTFDIEFKLSSDSEQS
jgi:hypothetical protein